MAISPYAKRLIDEFEFAVRQHAFKGAQMPEDHLEIEAQYKATKKQLIQYIAKLLTT